jgi:sulfur-oxidizing protein SoxA
MKTTIKVLTAGCAALALVAGGAFAGPDDDVLSIDGQAIATKVKAKEGNPIGDTLISGWHYRNDETQALQMDDFDNPAFVYVQLGEELWNTAEGESGQSCADCHGDASESMKGLRARMPTWSEVGQKPWGLEQWINWSRTEHQKASELKWDSQEMLALNAYISVQSRGMPVEVDISGPMEAWWKKGEELYYTRTGQLDFACASCHEDYNGQYLRSDHLSQGHTNGFPLYRLKWQGLGSLHRRLTGCVQDTRADPYPVASDELTALELYVAWRGEGLSVEAPAVRQ